MLAKKPGTPASSRNRSSMRVVLLSDMDFCLVFLRDGRTSALTHRDTRGPRLLALRFWLCELRTRTRSGIEHCELLRRLGRDAEIAQLVDHRRVDVRVVAVSVDDEMLYAHLACDQSAS